MKNKNAPLTHCLTIAFCLYAAGSAGATDFTSYAANTNLTLASGDTLTVSSGNVDISYGGSTTAAATLNASLATSVNFTIGSLRIGTRSDPTSAATSSIDGRLNLGLSNTITATTGVSIGGGGYIVSASLTTAASSNTAIYTPVMDLGTGMRTSTPAPNLTIGSGSTFTLQGISGGRTALTIGEERNASNSINWSSIGIMDLSGGAATLKLSSLVVGNAPITTSGEIGKAEGTLAMSSNSANQLDISGAGSVVRIATSAKVTNDTNNPNRNITNGTVTIGNLGSNSTITSTDNSTAILVGNRTGATGDVVTGTLNLNGGTVTITTTGAAIAGGSNATSNLNLDGGVTLKAGASSTNWIHNLDTAVINSGGATIHTNSYNLGISQAFTGAGGLTKDGAGTLTLNGANGYTGTTAVNAGTLALGSADRISDSSALSVTGGTFDLGGFTETVAGVSMSSGTITNGTLTGTSYSFTNSGTVSANLAGAAGLAKSGAGMLTISTTQSYAGATNVTGGTLVVDGNISTSSLTTIGNGVGAATLQGIGTTGALTISANAFHNPGNSAGIMNTGNYTMAGTLTAEINGLTAGSLHDQVNVGGTVSLSGNLVAAFGGGTYANGNLIFILLNDGTDAVSGTFTGLAQGATVTNYGGFDWQISYTGNSAGNSFTGGNDVVLMAVNAIPEPAAAILGSLGMLVLLRRRRD